MRLKLPRRKDWLKHLPSYLVLLLTWFIFSQELSLTNLLVGGLICLLPHIIFPEVFLRIINPTFISRIFFILAFLIYLLLEVFLSCYRLAYFALHKKISLQSSIYAYEYDLDNNTAIFFLSTVITLTPGTLVLDIDKSRKKLYIHTLHHLSGDKKSIFSTINLMEEWIRRIFE